MPQVVRYAARWLHGITASNIGIAPMRVAEILETRIKEFDDRDLDVLRRRVLTEERDTLDTVGRDHDVTRERVRQIESKISSAMAAWLTEDSHLGLIAAGIRFQLDPVMRLEKLLDANVHLSAQVQSVDRPAWYVVDKLDDEFESDGHWVAKPSLEHARNETQTRFDEITNSHGAAALTSVVEAFLPWTSLGASDLVEWLTHLGYVATGEYVFTPEVRNQPDKAAAMLSMVGNPVTTEELQRAVAPDSSIRSFRQRLHEDDRFTRTGPETWALAEWEVDSYSNIRTAIAEMVDVRGSVPLKDLITELTTTYGVSPKSVDVYARAWPFAIRDGRVVRAGEPAVARKVVADARYLYRDGDDLLFRICVNREHIRGSGSSISSALAGALDVRPSDRRIFNGQQGQVLVSWASAQPTLGSIRPALLELDAAVGDFVMLRFSASEVLLTKIDLASNDPLEQLAALVGVDQATPENLAARLEMEPPQTWIEIVRALRARGEFDTAGYIVEFLNSDAD